MSDDTAMTTYKLADGRPILGEYAFLTSLDGIEEDAYDPIELIEEVWVRTKVRTFWHMPEANGWCWHEVNGEQCEADAEAWRQDAEGWVQVCADHRDHEADTPDA